MIYQEFQGKQLSMLGFGAMRLPQNADKSIDEAQVARMVAYAMEHGVNYYDTAYPYHEGQSERVMGRVLKNYPRESFYLATKYPGHQIADSYDPAAVFEDQLQKCGVEYFDFYLLHNVYEKSYDVYTDPKWNIIPYFLEQKRLGRIRHLGFSTHAGVPFMRKFLEEYGKDMEFCQIQLNYLDWTLQAAKEKVDLLREFGVPVWVMEPVRGGKLANLGAEQQQTLRSLCPQRMAEEGATAMAFRFLQGVQGVTVVLSGMSSEQQMQENVQTFSAKKPLTEEECAALLTVADGMKNSVPCTGCRYCCDGCPMELPIPLLLSILNEVRVVPTTNTAMRIDALPAEQRPSACIGCGQCAQMCPQKIDIPQRMQELQEILQKIPSWADICRERAEALKRDQANKK